jgi:hypothetical protein
MVTNMEMNCAVYHFYSFFTHSLNYSSKYSGFSFVTRHLVLKSVTKETFSADLTVNVHDVIFWEYMKYYHGLVIGHRFYVGN